jgi:uncharacterized protein (DUF1330 family)
MPKGYVIAHITVRDPERYKEYVRLDTPVAERHGGRFIVRGGQSEVVEGEALARHVVIEFPSYAAARTFYADPEYQAAAEIRRATADSVIVIVEGHDG